MFSILIIVPTLNSYIKLPRLVNSLVNQTFINWKVLFIDGQSHSHHRDWLEMQCQKDPRFQWRQETDSNGGIFAAMNDGLTYANPDDWILFWGSDDMAADHDVFSRINKTLQILKRKSQLPYLYVCSGCYFSETDSQSISLVNLTKTRHSRFTWRTSFNSSLFWGSTPPHQATLFSPIVWNKLRIFDESFQITSDLDFFLRLSSDPKVTIFIDNIILVLMGNSGISAQKNKQRISEVVRSYRNSFGMLWFFPFFMRYTQKIISLIQL